MNVAITKPAPLLERNAEFERGLGGAHEVALVDSHQMVERTVRRDGCFADSDCADSIGFHQRYVQQGAKQA